MTMATKPLKPNQIMLDKVRTLAFDFNVFAQVEQITGKNLLALDAWQHFSATDIRAILFSSLSQEDSTLTIEDVGRLVTVKNVSMVTNRLFKLFETGDVSPLPEASG
jgi:hypothetical protein